MASEAGVQIDLIVRSTFASAAFWAILERSRIYYFHNNGREQILLGSADLMTRKLNDGVEVLFPVRDRASLKRRKDEVLPIWLKNARARIMQPDGSYEQPEHKKVRMMC